MKILIPLAEGLEEIEAITNIDVLRRAGIDVVTAGLDKIKVNGSHNLVITADTTIGQIKSEEFSGIILPGGMPGAANLRDDRRILDLIRDFYESQKMIAAICAAPIVLEKAGILKGHKATSYPGFADQMNSCTYLEDRVVVDDKLITGRGPGVALEFAITVIKFLCGEEKESKLKEQMLTNF